MGEFFSASVRYLKDSQTKESFMEKPYLQQDRGAMHQDWPKYVFPPRAEYPPLESWQPWKRLARSPRSPGGTRRGIYPRFGTEDPTNPTAVNINPGTPEEELSTSPDDPSGKEPGLFFVPTCNVDSDCDCLNIGESCKVLVASNKSTGMSFRVEISEPEALSATILPARTPEGKTYKDRAIIQLTALKEQTGNPVTVEVWGSSRHQGTRYGFVAPDESKEKLTIDITQWGSVPGLGKAAKLKLLPSGGGWFTSRCGWLNVTIPCDVCDGTETPVAWDYGSSDATIVRNGTANVVVTPGTGPYAWTVSGTGFSIPATTSGPTNTLSADNTACGSAEITVTDFCDNVTTGYVREEDNSEWSTAGVDQDVCLISGAADSWVSYGAQSWKLDGTLVQGNKRTVTRIGGGYGQIGGACIDCGDSGAYAGGTNCPQFCAGANCGPLESCAECLTGFVPKDNYTNAGSWNCWGRDGYECEGGWTQMLCACVTRIINEEWVCT
jgi:hypothetical protein